MSLLNKYSTPAERQKGCKFAERFDSAANLAKNGGAISGSVTWMSNGLKFNSVVSGVFYSTRPAIFNSAWNVFSGVIEFIPEFNYDDNLIHYFTAVPGANYGILKRNNAGNNTLRVLCGGTTVADALTATYGPLWKVNQVNRIAWSCVSGVSNSLYLNGVALPTGTITWTPAVVGGIHISFAGSNAFLGTICSYKLFTPSTSAQALTPKDCEVLSAGTTYTYWKDATCIMDGLSANYDPVNYRHLDISGNANHVLLGNGAGTGTPTKLSAQGYSFNGSSHYMTVPLAAWPGTSGTMLFDVSVSTNAATHRLFGTDHTSGGNFEVFSSVSAPNDRIIMGNGTGQTACNLGADFRWNKIIVGATWLTNGTIKGYTNGLFAASSNINATTPYTPTTSWWLAKYDASYLTGTLRSFLSFNRELSSIQIADATLWMQKLRNRV